MRVPIPERFSFQAILIFMSLVFVGQMIVGTDFIFAILTAAFIGIWALAFNIAGGIQYTSGAFIFFNGLLTAIFGLIVKILLLEPGERNLVSPRNTMFCYCVGMAAMAIAAFLARNLRSRQALIKNFDSLAAMKTGAVTCLILTLLIVASSGLTSQGGTIGSAIAQINRFPLMGIMLATTYEVRVSGGKRSTNWIVWTGMILDIVFGLTSFSKEGMLIGPAAWILAAALNRFSFSWRQIFVCILGLAFTTYYLVPYSQYVRNFHGATGAENAAVAVLYLSDLNRTRELYLDAIAEIDVANEPHLFDQREGFLDRIVMLAPDDTLIDYTDRGHVFGLEPTFQMYANIVPHFIWQGKAVYNTGNLYAHELGQLADDDVTTGISFSPTADAYHQAKWLGLLLLLPIDLVIAFLITDSLAGSSKNSIWAMLPILEVAHLAPEAGLNGVVYLSTYWVVAILFLYWATQVAPSLVMRSFRRTSRSRSGFNNSPRPTPI